MFSKLENFIMVKYGTPSGNWSGGKAVRKEYKVLGRRVKFEWRSPDGMGRFGGGWNIELGFQIGGSTIIINMIFCSLRIDKRRGK